jgi:hypothetical protein
LREAAVVDVRKLRIFTEGVQKAKAFREDVSVLGAYAEDKGLFRAKVTVSSSEGNFQLHFTIGADDEVTGLGPNGWRVPDCLLTPKSIESAIKDAIQWKLGPSPFNSE